MKPDPKKEAERWLLQGENELAASENLMENGFYAQQAAEKPLKGLTYLQGARLVLGRSVLELLQALITLYPQLGKCQQTAGILDLSYIAPRYPNAVPGLAPFQVFSRKQAQEAVEGADGILREAQQILQTAKGGA